MKARAGAEIVQSATQKGRKKKKKEWLAAAARFSPRALAVVKAPPDQI